MPSPVKRALISVSDKEGLIDFAKSLVELGIEIISTGGTAKALGEAGIAVHEVSSITGFPEILDGRVKTLHPKVHGGLLAKRSDPAHAEALKLHGIGTIDLLAVNLYPFEEKTSIETIDIGGPAMIRSAAKNHDSVTVIVDPHDYAEVIDELKRNGGATLLETRTRLAAKAYGRTAAYDAAIAQWLATTQGYGLPDYFVIGGRQKQLLRYGENPHQKAALYETPERRPGVAAARQLQGRELSYNNLNDTDAALECLAEFGASETACVIVKHSNPCGVATGGSALEAYQKALRCDPVSAFGGIVAINRALDRATAKAIVALFTEVIAVADAKPEATALIAAKKNLRLLVFDELPGEHAGWSVKTIAGGLLVQSVDGELMPDGGERVVTRRSPTPAELADLRFALKVAKHVKSNAIVFAKDGATLGIGAGQMSRIDAARIARRKSQDAGLTLQGSVAASDAFFPFADGLEELIEAGASAVIQPGGSVRDDEVVAAADAAGVAMIFTGMRHFRH